MRGHNIYVLDEKYIPNNYPNYHFFFVFLYLCHFDFVFTFLIFMFLLIISISISTEITKYGINPIKSPQDIVLYRSKGEGGAL